MSGERDRRPATGGLVRLLFLAVGLVACGAGLWQMVQVGLLLRSGSTTIGTVPAADDPGATLAHPLVMFTTATGHAIRYRQNGYSASPGHDRVAVLYDPADPENTATVRAFSTLWLPILLPLTLGGAALVLVAASFIRSRTT